MNARMSFVNGTVNTKLLERTNNVKKVTRKIISHILWSISEVSYLFLFELYCYMCDSDRIPTLARRTRIYTTFNSK